MTYRSFCEPKELLGLLIERFDIKDPPYFDVNNGLPGVYANGSSADPSSPVDSDLMKRDAMKKFRKKYAQPIQIRCKNFFSLVIDCHRLSFLTDNLTQSVNFFFVSFRVLNVMRHWFDGHWYDFEQDAELLESFKNFLKRIEESKHIKKWVKNFLEIIVRKVRKSAELFLKWVSNFLFLRRKPLATASKITRRIWYKFLTAIHRSWNGIWRKIPNYST